MGKLTTILVVVVVLGFMPIVFAGPSSIDLSATVRDFHGTNNLPEWNRHPDFEDGVANDRGFVADTIGSDRKPVYVGGSGTATTHGADNFNQWYNNTPGINMTKTISLTLNETSPGSGVYSYSNGDFFPIDGELFGNEGWSHNYSFTLEMHNKFSYESGQQFTFTGDDDVFVFINNKLVIDLGGVHGAESESVDLDTLGLTEGGSYNLDLFFAERHTSQSSFRIDTSLVLEQQPNVIPAPGAILLGGIGVTLVGWLRKRKTL